MTDPSLNNNGTEQHVVSSRVMAKHWGNTSAIGARKSNAGGADWHDGQVAEIIITSSPPSASDRQRIEGYLAQMGPKAICPMIIPTRANPRLPLLRGIQWWQ